MVWARKKAILRTTPTGAKILSIWSPSSNRPCWKLSWEKPVSRSTKAGESVWPFQDTKYSKKKSARNKWKEKIKKQVGIISKDCCSKQANIYRHPSSEILKESYWSSPTKNSRSQHMQVSKFRHYSSNGIRLKVRSLLSRLQMVKSVSSIINLLCTQITL